MKFVLSFVTMVVFASSAVEASSMTALAVCVVVALTAGALTVSYAQPFKG